jgi:hypothetical protein
MDDSLNIGKVIIAGAGPGDVELITLKLQKRLAEAEVIIVDRLVNPEIIDKYASPQALTLMTGKQGYHDGSVAQEDINKLIIGHAKNGKTVLRLKVVMWHFTVMCLMSSLVCRKTISLLRSYLVLLPHPGPQLTPVFLLLLAGIQKT